MLEHRFFSQSLMIAGLSVMSLSGLLASRLLASPIPTTLPTLSKQSSPAPSPLRSQPGIDYAPLQQLLQAKKWQEANQLTSVLVLKAASQEQQGYLRATDTRNLACSDLRTVDRLWRAASGGHFGFSTQATIWRKLKGNSYEDSLRFEQQVGWNSDLLPATAPSTVPAGFYPFRPAGYTGIKNAFGGWWIREMPLRLKQCGIN
jgi:GUN4-like